jgi:hypothetical protein
MVSYRIRSGLLDDLLALNTEAFAEGEYEVAYHMLMGALHLTERLGKREALERIAAAGAAQAAVVEAARVFENLGAHVNAVRQRMDRAEQLRARRSSSPAA